MAAPLVALPPAPVPPLVARPPSQVHKNRLAANKHNRTDPDMITVIVMSTKLPKAVENIGIERPAARTDLALRKRVFPDRFFVAMVRSLREGQAFPCGEC